MLHYCRVIADWWQAGVPFDVECRQYMHYQWALEKKDYQDEAKGRQDREHNVPIASVTFDSFYLSIAFAICPFSFINRRNSEWSCSGFNFRFRIINKCHYLQSPTQGVGVGEYTFLNQFTGGGVALLLLQFPCFFLRSIRWHYCCTSTADRIFPGMRKGSACNFELALQTLIVSAIRLDDW